MAGNLTRFILLLASLCTIGAAQIAVYPCQEPAQIRELTIDQVRSRLSAGQSDFFLYKRLEDLTPSVPKPGSLAKEFAQRLREHPSDGGLTYLYGRSLIGKDSPEAIVQLNHAAETTPSLPWTYSALAEVYASPNFKDEAKLLANMRMYRKLCPANIDGFRYLNKLNDAAETAAWARELRPLLEKSTNPEDGQYWQLLWAAEFRTIPQAEYDAQRARVAADVKRLEALPQTNRRMQLGTLWDGYNLSGQTDAADRMERRLDPDQGLMRIYDAWLVKAGLRGDANLTAEQRQAANREYAKISAEWTAKWPDSRMAWGIRLVIMTADPNWTKEELEQVGEKCLKLEAEHWDRWTYIPAAVRVSQQWVRYGIRLKDSVKMAQDSLSEILLGPEEPNDLTAPPNAAEHMKLFQFGFDVSVWDCMNTIVDGAVQLKDFDTAHHTLERMQHWLDENQFKKDDATTGYPRFQSFYLQRAASLAEAEGHKVDAVALYMRAIANGGLDPELRKHVRALWDEQGGTRDGWAIATKRMPAPKPSEKPPVYVATEFAAWTTVGKALPRASLRDSLGNTWSVSSLNGKPTFVNLFATWCTPCREELPQIQKLYELSRQRGDFQVMTFSMDENPGELAPFLKANGYTFPVALARQYAESVVGPVTMPQNWLVDAKGMVQEKSLGFDTKIADWPQEMADKVAHLAR